MSNSSKIEWTESTWNPITGCNKISQGCKFCYAERMAYRLKMMGQKNYINGFNLSIHDHTFNYPLKWKKPMMIFVNSMSDLFHKGVPLHVIKKIFNVMQEAHWHTFQILTKRADRLVLLSPKLVWPKNVWMGVSVESQEYINRIDQLRQTDAKVKFLSLEPLLCPISSINLLNIDWVIVGGESGPGSRPIKEEWVKNIRDQCLNSNIPFFFKQWGGVNKKKSGRLLENRTWDELPYIYKPAS